MKESFKNLCTMKIEKTYLLTLLVLLFLFSCGGNENPPKQTEDEYLESISSYVSEEETSKEVSKTEKEKENSEFLKKLGISEYINLENSEITILKKADSIGIFKDKKFCEFYKDFKKYEFAGDFKKSDKVIESFNKVEGLSILLMVNGYKMCPDELKELKGKRSGSTEHFSESKHACSMSEDFIKMDLRNPSTAKFSMFDCNVERNANGSYTILRKVKAKNKLGVEGEIIYKVVIGYVNGHELDTSSWKLISIQSQEI